LRIGHLGFRFDQDTFGGLGVGQPPEQSQGTLLGDDGSFLVGPDAGCQVGEELFQPDESTAGKQHVSEDAGGLEAVVGCPRGTAETLGRGPVEGEVSVARGGQQEPGCGGATTVEAPQRQADRVVTGSGTLALEAVGQCAGEPPAPQVRQ
jgi:hypothetical protein